MKSTDIIKMVDYIKKQTGHNGDIFINVNVEAIPIEWIEKKIQIAVDFMHSKEEGKLIYDGAIVSVVSASFTANCLMNLLEDWRKENDHQERPV